MAERDGGRKTKITQFQEMVRALQEFKTYLFMKKGSVFCTVIHSPMKLMALNKDTKHLQDASLDSLEIARSYKTPRQFSFQLRKPGNRSRKWCSWMGLPSLRFMRRTCCTEGCCGHQQPIVKKPRAMYRGYYTYRWCCSC
jgi:hypothetical protein